MIDAGSGCSGSSVVADFASLLLSSNVPLLYVSTQLGHAKATTTLDHYAKWLPSGEQRFVNLLDSEISKLGAKIRYQLT